jgi:lipopolysaccharide export system permease protein
MLLTSLIVFWLRPAAELGIQEVKASQKSMTEFDLLIPGRFQVLNSGSRVTYVQSLSEDQLLENIFMTERAVDDPSDDAKVVTMVAASGEARLDASGDRFLVLQDGRRYRSVSGGKAHQVIVFEEFGQRLQRDQYDIESAEVRERSLGALLQAPDRAAWAEIQWRLSLVLMIPILVLLAVPLGRVEPRDGRFSRVAPGVLLCFLYLVLLSGARSAVTEGRFPVMPGLFSVHLGFLILAVILLNAGEKSLNWFKTKRKR